MPEIQSLRDSLRQSGATMLVTKNTLLARACTALGKEELTRFLGGPMFIVWSRDGDEISVLKTVLAFQRASGKIEMRAGILHGDVIDAEGIAYLSSLPGTKEIRAKIVLMARMPAMRIVMALNAPMRKLILVLRQIGARKENHNGKEGC